MDNNDSDQLLADVIMKSGAKNHLTARYIRNLHQSLTVPKTIQSPNIKNNLSNANNQETTDIFSYCFIKYYLQKHKLNETISCFNDELKFPLNEENELESAIATLQIPNNLDPIQFLMKNQIPKNQKPKSKKKVSKKSNGHIVSRSSSNFSFHSDNADSPIPKKSSTTSKNGRKRKNQNLMTQNKLKNPNQIKEESNSPIINSSESFPEAINSNILNTTPTRRNKSTPKRSKKNINSNSKTANENQQLQDKPADSIKPNENKQIKEYETPFSKENIKLLPIPKRVRKANSARRPIKRKNRNNNLLDSPQEREISQFEQTNENKSYKSDSQSQTESPKLQIETSMLAQKTTILSISDSYHVSNISSIVLDDVSPPTTPKFFTTSEFGQKEPMIENASFERKKNFVLRTYGDDAGNFSDIPNQLSQIEKMDEIVESRNNIKKEINFSLDNIERVTADVRDFDIKDIQNKDINKDSTNNSRLNNHQINEERDDKLLNDDAIIIDVTNENAKKKPTLQIQQTNCHSQCFDSDVPTRSSQDNSSSHHHHHRSQSAPHRRSSSEHSQSKQDSSERRRIRVRVKKNKSQNESLDDKLDDIRQDDRILKRIRVRRSASVNSGHHDHSDSQERHGSLTRVRVRKNKNNLSDSNSHSKSSHRRSSSVSHHRNDDSSMVDIKVILSDKNSSEKHRKSSCSSSVQSHHHKPVYQLVDVATSTPKYTGVKKDSEITPFLFDKNSNIENENAYIHSRRSSSSSKKENIDNSHFSSYNDNLTISQIDRNVSQLNESSKHHEILSESSRIKETISDSSAIQESKKESSAIQENKMESSAIQDNKKESSAIKENKSETSKIKQNLMDESSQSYSTRPGTAKRSKRVKTSIQIDSDIMELDSVKSKSSRASNRSRSKLLSSSFVTASPVTSDVPTSEYEIIQTPIKDLLNKANKFDSSHEHSSMTSDKQKKTNDKIVKRGNDYLNKMFNVASSSDDEDNASESSNQKNSKSKQIKAKRTNYSSSVNSHAGYQAEINDELLHSSSSRRRKVKKSKRNEKNANNRKLELLDLSYSSSKHHHGTLMNDEANSSSSFVNDSQNNQLDDLTSSSFISSKNSNYNPNSNSRRSISDDSYISNELFQLTPEANEGILIDLSSQAERRSRSSSRSSQRNETKENYKLKIVQLKNLPKHDCPIGCLVIIDEEKEFTTERKEGEIIVFNTEYQFVGSPSTVISIDAITNDNQDSIATFSAPISQFKLAVNQWCEMKPEGIAQVVIEQL